MFRHTAERKKLPFLVRYYYPVFGFMLVTTLAAWVGFPIYQYLNRPVRSPTAEDLDKERRLKEKYWFMPFTALSAWNDKKSE